MECCLATAAIEVSESIELSRQEYDLIRRLVYAQSGINLGESKTQLVRVRLGKLVRGGGFPSFRAYYEAVQADAGGQMLRELLDAITTNTTHLFREARHFQFLRDVISKWTADSAWRSRHNTLRLWSAACSSGEEPHSMAMVADDVLSQRPGIGLKILATDLSTQVLEEASQALYEPHRVGTVPADLRARYLQRVSLDGIPMLQVVPQLRKAISFVRFNLMTPTFPFKNGFHVIFCRNVMIYFDRQTQQALVNKLAAQLLPGGYLMIGHSESLNGIEQPLRYVEPTIYQREK